jgi:predicted RNA binding protein YcfA (HicA-like mRNA interferase family)
VAHFPIDAPKLKVIKALELLGFSLVREREHIAMIRENADGSKTPLTLPNHSKIKGSTNF